VPVHLLVSLHSYLPLSRHSLPLHQPSAVRWDHQERPSLWFWRICTLCLLHQPSRLPYALRGCLCRSLHPEPLGRSLDLRLDAGEVHPAQSHHDFMAVQGGFERDAHRYLWRTRPLQMGLTIGTIGLGVVFATSLADNVLRRHRDNGGDA
jgi:hypothetical protein